MSERTSPIDLHRIGWDIANFRLQGEGLELTNRQSQRERRFDGYINGHRITIRVSELNTTKHHVRAGLKRRHYVHVYRRHTFLLRKPGERSVEAVTDFFLCIALDADGLSCNAFYLIPASQAPAKFSLHQGRRKRGSKYDVYRDAFEPLKATREVAAA